MGKGVTGMGERTARIASAILLACLGLGWFVAGPAAAAPAHADEHSTAEVDAYLDDLAVKLAHAGLYVDPGVDEASLDTAEIERLDRIAAATRGPVRVAVVPVEKVDLLADGTDDNPEQADLAYDANELVAQLYDRVGVDGIYVIVVDAESRPEGRSFTAHQFAEEGPTYDVEGGVDAAVDCCAPHYAPMIERFLSEAGDEQSSRSPVRGWLGVVAVVALLAGTVVASARPQMATPGGQIDLSFLRWPVILGVFGGGYLLSNRIRHADADDWMSFGLVVLALVAVVVALVVAGSLLRRWRRVTRERAVVATLKPLITEDVVQLSTTLGALPPLPADAPEQQRTTLAAALQLVSEASERLDQITDAASAEAVVARLSDAQYEMVKLQALQAGRDLPKRKAPCFIDPRHGPGPQSRSFAPEGGASREIRVCDACAATLDRNQAPVPRTITVEGVQRPYWEAERYARPYVNGYWQSRPFPDKEVERSRRAPVDRSTRASRPKRERAFTFVWEGGSGGSGRSGGSRSSARSFGGGRSRRSRSRSGGSRGF